MGEFDFGLFISSGAVYVHLAGLLYAIGLGVRDQLILRLLILAGTCCYLIYYYIIAETPLWDAVIWSSVLGTVNLYIIVQIYIERTTFFMSPDEQRLYKAFQSMSPGEFRRLSKLCTWQRIDEATVLTVQGESNTRLYYLMNGQAEVVKNNVSLEVGERSFIGEVSYLLKTPASATVTMPKSSYLAVWSHADLERLEKKYPAIRIAMREVLNVDLAAKMRLS